MCVARLLPEITANTKHNARLPCSYQDQFVTVGDDGTVRVWSNGDKKVIRTLNIG